MSVFVPVVELWFLIHILKEWNPTNPTINLYLLGEASLEQFWSVNYTTITTTSTFLHRQLDPNLKVENTKQIQSTTYLLHFLFFSLSLSFLGCGRISSSSINITHSKFLASAYFFTLFKIVHTYIHTHIYINKYGWWIC